MPQTELRALPSAADRNGSDPSAEACAGLNDAALAYLARGWSVIPIEPRGKRPLVQWTAYQQRRATSAEVDGWFRRWPNANLGIVTGAVSGIVVLDVDRRHGGALSLAQLDIEIGPVPMTVEAATGGRGRHLYFRHPGSKVANRVGLRPGIDLRGDGGCVVAPPSVHPSGRRYTWVLGHSPAEIEIALLPAWLLSQPEGMEGGSGDTRAHWRQLVRDGITEGSRNSTLASLTGHLLWHGVDTEVALELLLAWNRMRCRPPLPDAEVAGVVESVARLRARQAGDRRD
jgi:bifunctional DNA primase/polymerase-like protein/primase-like protein